MARLNQLLKKKENNVSIRINAPIYKDVLKKKQHA